MASRYLPRASGLLTTAALAGLLGLVAVEARDADRTAPPTAGATASLIERIVARTSRTDVAVRAVRELRAGTRSGKHEGWMEVETTLSPTGGFSWRVLEEGGSERTRDKVFRELLRAEEHAWRTPARDAAALTPHNYVFEPLPPTTAGQARLRLKPRRADARLIDGVLTVSADGYPLRLEGRLAKSPSFWVKSVTVIRRYGRFANVSLPLSLESTADLKLFGASTLSMRYRYLEINGRRAPQALASLQ